MLLKRNFQTVKSNPHWTRDGATLPLSGGQLFPRKQFLLSKAYIKRETDALGKLFGKTGRDLIACSQFCDFAGALKVFLCVSLAKVTRLHD